MYDLHDVELISNGKFVSNHYTQNPEKFKSQYRIWVETKMEFNTDSKGRIYC